ncbi:MAG: hypothetical protein FVQ83_10475 [Chloroflexi bacterium]|nr:hypothetical protein [Chloroflexota bacterium]
MMNAQFSRQANILALFSYALNIPPTIIWLIVILKLNRHPLGSDLAIWLRNSFSEISVLILWLVFPSMALILGLGGYSLGGNKFLTIGVVALSSILLLMIIVGATLQVSG